MHISSSNGPRDNNLTRIEEVKNLLKCFSACGESFFNKILELACKSSNKDDRREAARILQSNKLQANRGNIQKVLAAVEIYRSNHPRQKESIRTIEVDENRTKNQAKLDRKALRNLAKEGFSISNEEYIKTVQIALQDIEALHPIKSPYFGIKVASKGKMEVPSELANSSEIISRHGYSLIEVVDHLLIANSTTTISSIGVVLKLFPGNPHLNTGHAYSRAIQEVNKVITNPQSAEVWALLAESAERVGALCRDNKLFNRGFIFSRSPKHPYADRQGAILEVEPGFKAAHYFHGLQKSNPLHIVAPDPWEAEVLRVAIPNAKKELIKVHDFGLVNLKLDTFYQTIRINGDRALLDSKELDFIPQLSALIQREGKLIIDFASTPTNRHLASQGNFRNVLYDLISNGPFNFNYQLGLTAMVEISGPLKRLFYPKTCQTRDVMHLYKCSNIDKNLSIERAQDAFDFMETLALFQDPAHWNFFMAALDNSSHLSELAISFQIDLEDGQFIEHDIIQAKKLLQKGDFEGLAKHVTTKGIFAGPYGTGRENFKDTPFTNLGELGIESIRNSSMRPRSLE